MATTGVGFRWLDLLEKEFDKACVELDTSLADVETEEPEVVFGARQKIATLSSCFAQLTHKALTIFQNSAKLEAELVDMRAELVQARTASEGCKEGGDLGLVTDAARTRAEAAQLARENAALRETVLALHSELFGARLATKYLDKELAGRIQQLQLLGRDMRADVRDSLWAQVEAEILLQRHKTLVRVCRGLSPRPARPAPATRARPRTVRVRRPPHLGLGISVTGGREHGVPVLISELEAGGPAALCGQLYVGDAILSINDRDLTQACHKEAVQALQSVKGDCALCVQFIATDDEDRLSEDNYRFPLYPEHAAVFEEGGGAGATPTAPRTPEYSRQNSDAESGSECSDRLGHIIHDPHINHVTNDVHVNHVTNDVHVNHVTNDVHVNHVANDVHVNHVTQVPYPDYNNINNNLDILDMDDDEIKIEARLEMVEPGGASPELSPRGRAWSRVSASPRSTPVHAPRHTRRAQDWRTKGAYRAIADDNSSDEPSREPCDGVVEAPSVPLPPRHEVPAPPNNMRGPAETRGPPELSRGPSDLTRGPAGVSRGPADVTRGPQEATRGPSDEPRGPVESVRGPNDARRVRRHDKPRRESKAFRIGTARRVTEHSIVKNGDVEGKFPRLLAGDGDPDFGTPV